MTTTYRTCPRTGLQFEAQAEKLMIANAFMAVVALLVGGLLAIGVVLTRWPAVHWLPADTFYMVLTAHGIDMLIFWIIFFEVAVLYFASSTLLRCRIATPKIAWLGFALMLIGAVWNNIVVFQGESSVMMTSYVPMMAHWSFYLSLILFAVGALVACFVFFGTLVVAKRDKTYEGSVPLVTFGATTAAIIAVFTILSGAGVLVPTFFVSIGLLESVDPLMYRVVWWAFGHSSQQINVAAHISIWYAVAAIAFGAKPMSERVSRGAFLLYILFLQLASAHHILADPGVSTEWKVVNTSYFMYFAVLGSMIHALSIPGAMEVAQRARGYNKGLFEWLRKAPWSNPTFSGVFIALVGFGFLGGTTGVMMGTEQLNLLIHNTIYVPGHFHATVVVGTTLTFMALTYFLIPSLFRREMIAPGLARLQPYLFGFSMYFFCLVMMGAGTLGVSRRHWDMAFSGNALAYEWPGAAYLMMGLVGISGVAAIAGGVIYVYVTVGSLLWGKKLDAGVTSPKFTPVARAAPTAAAQTYGSAGFVAPGTFVLAMFFLVTFVLYYFVNWKYLGQLWGLS
ncbi:MAG TPA: cbb3-type cytochrome c oxidase subunit I [Alicycliphilus sp.]|jgi:cytochrome c oxidase subunit 1|uniref:Cbb3-type cytochrome c oxidase subunit I n=1 Tax=Diaphorobacter limosus TaxID=3036128 RepID=A0ABZ0J6S1_9BURK|nr:cbb3-type cytochrome c oxidase subunit I [Diaphorobacter sp. Y-1]MBP6752076.1 cbb3-type cytochrome c oxidase subunit I [Alicycliphilus sp.]MCA0440337.1 cbb3-type cytochrome c oxidase subunit I [Pseudomonadota bacterium]MBP7325109.1 cbb3-type cytochrome c oxidase subunit I [Alicycliphilus sp.]MBP7328456.1 cbb3-type cytochrome c oxidase subunit I [Alicycliphilus sp.]MBP8779172.1 cbb3-type cytochrome c oxidase subunit I [Alicycliphilus sp.]